jgi:hypothetical protein
MFKNKSGTTFCLGFKFVFDQLINWYFIKKKIFWLKLTIQWLLFIIYLLLLSFQIAWKV